MGGFDGRGGSAGVGVEVVGAPDSAASLAEERVTLGDMSNRSHQYEWARKKNEGDKV